MRIFSTEPIDLSYSDAENHRFDEDMAPVKKSGHLKEESNYPAYERMKQYHKYSREKGYYQAGATTFEHAKGKHKIKFHPNGTYGIWNSDDEILGQGKHPAELKMHLDSIHGETSAKKATPKKAAVKVDPYREHLDNYGYEKTGDDKDVSIYEHPINGSLIRYHPPVKDAAGYAFHKAKSGYATLLRTPKALNDHLREENIQFTNPGGHLTSSDEFSPFHDGYRAYMKGKAIDEHGKLDDLQKKRFRAGYGKAIKDLMGIHHDHTTAMGDLQHSTETSSDKPSAAGLRWWHTLTHEQQTEYLKEHPNSGYGNHLKRTAATPIKEVLTVVKSPTVKPTKVNESEEKISGLKGLNKDSTHNFLSAVLWLYKAWENEKKIDPKVVAKAEEFQELNKIPHFKQTVAASVKGDWDTACDGLEGLGAWIKEKLVPGIEKTSSIPIETTAMAKDVGLLCRSDSEAAQNRIIAKMKMLNDTDLSRSYSGEQIADLGTQEDDRKTIRNITERQFGKPIDKLTPEQAAKFRLDNPDGYKEYLRAARGLKEKYNAHLRDIVRHSGEESIPHTHAATELKKRGIHQHYFPEGFVGNVDEEGKLRTSRGLMLSPQPNPNLAVRMNPKYKADEDNAYYMASIPDGKIAQGETRYMTVNKIKTGKETKFAKVASLVKAQDKLDAKLLEDITGKELSDKRILATMVGLVTITGDRIGTEGNSTAGENTYGVSTLLRKHVTVQRNAENKITAVVIEYPGKKGVMQKRIIDGSTQLNRNVGQTIVKLIYNKTPNEPVFEYEGKTYTGNMVNKYVSSIIGEPTTIHKFRHAVATEMTKAIIEKSPFTAGGVSQREAENWFLEAMKGVGEKLGHVVRDKEGKDQVTGRTAVKSYADPTVSRKFFEDLNLQIPKFLTE